MLFPLELSRNFLGVFTPLDNVHMGLLREPGH
jgi:hypothetical protein